MERRFYIAVNDELPIHITESELKRRIDEIRDDALSMSDCFSMIVHGRWQHEYGERKMPKGRG